MALVLGLGNPGPRYALTRHNAGWRVLDRLVERWGATPAGEHRTWRAWSAVRSGREAWLVKPLTFMNLSAEAVESWRAGRALDVADLLVVVDDVYLPVGTLRLRGSGSSGGHRGLESLAQVLGTGFARLRVGVGRAGSAAELREHVLEEFAEDEQAVVEEALTRAADAVECWLAEGLIAAMNRFNRRVSREESES